jgi:hypothetical protein
MCVYCFANLIVAQPTCTSCAVWDFLLRPFCFRASLTHCPPPSSMEGGHNANLPTRTVVDRVPRGPLVRWTSEDVAALPKGVSIHTANWSAIIADASLSLGARTPSSLESKWRSLRASDPDLQPARSDTQWTSEDVAALHKGVSIHGAVDWSDLQASLFRARLTQSCIAQISAKSW